MTNKVELIGHYGDDRTIAQSAWTSTSRELTDSKIERIPDLLKMLADNGHLTPFEKSSLHFLVTVDQATHIHLLKHRIGVSINGESARYKELKEDKTYIPDDWVGNDILDKHRRMLVYMSEALNKSYHECLSDLTPILGRKRAKESARYFKMMNSQITMDVMFNFRSFIHFQKLRNDEHAQVEVREVAQQMLELVQQLPDNPFEHSLKAFGYGPK
jgi:flavin-dependent thymidylate synthase